MGSRRRRKMWPIWRSRSTLKWLRRLHKSRRKPGRRGILRNKAKKLIER